MPLDQPQMKHCSFQRWKDRGWIVSCQQPHQEQMPGQLPLQHLRKEIMFFETPAWARFRGSFQFQDVHVVGCSTPRSWTRGLESVVWESTRSSSSFSGTSNAGEAALFVTVTPCIYVQSSRWFELILLNSYRCCKNWLKMMQCGDSLQRKRLRIHRDDIQL